MEGEHLEGHPALQARLLCTATRLLDAKAPHLTQHFKDLDALDAAFAHMVLHYMPAPEEVVAEMARVLATGEIWVRVPATVRVRVGGRLGDGVAAKDVALALLAPEDKVDFVEIMQFNSIHPQDWYRFLNIGFRLPAAGGSDWPYMALPGSVRTYVQIDGEFTPSSWKR